MFSLRAISVKKATVATPPCVRCIALSYRPFTTAARRTSPGPRRHVLRNSPFPLPRSLLLRSSRSYASKSSADGLIDGIQDQYATARDEFEIASEETEKKSVYAEADRAAAREELDKLKNMYNSALMGESADEIHKRVGHRIRELDHAVQALEEAATEH